VAEKEHTILSSDREKFIHYIRHLNSKKQKLSDINDRLAEELQLSGKSPLLDEDINQHYSSMSDHLIDAQLQNLDTECNELKEIIANQKVSPADIARMTAEQEQLANLVAKEMEKEASASKLAWEQEVVCQRQVDEVSDLGFKKTTTTEWLTFI
jgi:SMC interacting uncharacterized protein involved in chromosome segregation